MLARLLRAYLKAWIALGIATIFFSCIAIFVDGASVSDIVGMIQLILTTPLFLGGILIVSVLLALTFAFDKGGPHEGGGFGSSGDGGFQ